MNIVVVDDSEFKRYTIKKNIDLIDTNSSYKEFVSLNSILTYLIDNQENIDLLVLDWNFPYFDYDRAKDGAGELVLSYMKDASIIVPVIICSSDEIAINSDYSNFVLGEVVFDPSKSLENDFSKLLTKREKVMNKIKSEGEYCL